jgi:hypothetical protein
MNVMGEKNLPQNDPENQEKKCKIPNCNHKPIYKHDEGMICKKHYDALRSRGTVEPSDYHTNTICKANDCNNKATRKSLCGKHYQRWKLKGDWNYKTKAELYQNRSCSVVGCNKHVKSKYLCDKHYRRYLKHNDPNVIKHRYDNYIKNAICIQCGNKIPQKFGSLKYCSGRCTARHRDNLPDMIHCIICGEKFKGGHGKITCSDVCKHNHKHERTKKWNEHQRTHNPEYQRLRAGAQRRRRSKIIGTQVEQFEDIEIFERDNWKCQICGKKVNKNKKYPHPMSPSIDHIVPLSLDGAHTRLNVQLAHISCNKKKSNTGIWDQLRMFG